MACSEPRVSCEPAEYPLRDTVGHTRSSDEMDNVSAGPLVFGQELHNVVASSITEMENTSSVLKYHIFSR